MREMTELETQLRSWAPRRPSGELRRRLFGCAAGSQAERPATARLGDAVVRTLGRKAADISDGIRLVTSAATIFGRALARLSPRAGSRPLSLAWYAPCALAVVAACLLFTQRHPSPAGGTTASSPVLAMILSNQSATAAWMGSSQSKRNLIPPPIVLWTNARPLVSGFSPFLSPKSRYQ